MNNTIVQAPPAERGRPTDPFALIWFCDGDNVSRVLPDYGNEMLPVIEGNAVYNREAAARVTCGYSEGAEPDLPLEVFTYAGLFPGHTVGPLPSDEEALAWAAAVLGMRR